MKKVGWQSISPIYADIMISPWNLLVGGLLIKFLPTTQAFLSIIIGYVILSGLFIFYGGLGFKEKKQSAWIINEIFGSKITKYLVPSILAIGQIGWASINIELGGKSLAYVFSSPIFIGVAVYAIFLVVMGILDLYKMGIVKLLITISSVTLLGYVFVSKISQVSLTNFFLHKPIDQQSLLWGVSIIVASLISFTTVTPDFFQSVKSKKDVVISTLLGLFVPGVLTALLGCFLFFDKGNFNLIALLSALTFPIFPHILNASTNTDGSIAIYTPGLKLQNMFGINLKTGIIIAGLASFTLALFQVSSHLEVWLKILSLLFPTLIGLVLTKFVLQKQSEINEFNRMALLIYVISTVISIGLTKLFPPVLISLFLPFVLYKSFRFIFLARTK
ncbi:hypothetical protein COT02_06185 [Candidatus Roizmanbacteria bacterium CG07_land_8_20_14_0_80_34_15]|uniref:Cytosine permease n=1 Tax=Candidatus Roizmanbacteria bacterium CG07_land_8_20_14_0_80_34_15 TaxID=1974849 RepID=A0A2M6YSB2_9BACT|nr:MAG: hypothetical protein COT02_06185 [Candidatus Roizmanbacteria bacterium CG07_land_8_20_14_0_80_34_15]